MTQGARLVASIAAAALAPSLACAQAQNTAVVDAVAAKVVQKYEGSTCQQLAEQRQAPKTAQKEAAKERVGQMLRQNPQMRAHFVSKVAAPIADKMIACGFIP